MMRRRKNLQYLVSWAQWWIVLQELCNQLGVEHHVALKQETETEHKNT